MSREGKSCKGICKNFKVKKTAGRGRYGSGQGRCQMCDVWMNFRGAHLKGGIPATIDSVGWFCNCCNYRIRQKPRNKVYKEKLRNQVSERQDMNAQIDTQNSKEQGWIKLANEVEKQQEILKCPQCTENNHCWGDEAGCGCECSTAKTGSKTVRKKTKELLSTYEPKEEKKITIEQISSTNELDVETINKLITKSLELIQKNSVGIYLHILKKELKISEKDFDQILPRLLRLENIVEENETIGSTSRKVIRRIENDEKDDSKNKDRIKSQKQNQVENDIKNLSYQMVQEYTHSKANINKKFKIECIKNYQKYQSLDKIFEIYPNITKEKIKRHTATALRLPKKLKQIENEGGLHPDPRCSLAIALFATDHFQWDGENEKNNEVVELAKNISRYLQSDRTLYQLFK